ncbi:MAG: hypothetical protein WBG37_14375 [Desulfobacterales bacterium]
MDNKHTLALCVMAAFIFMLLVLTAQLSAGESEPIIVRSSIATEPEIWVGQRVLMQVDVLARDEWAKIKKAPDVEVPGAYVVRLETQGVRLNETIDGSAYTG